MCVICSCKFSIAKAILINIPSEPDDNIVKCSDHMHGTFIHLVTTWLGGGGGGGGHTLRRSVHSSLPPIALNHGYLLISIVIMSIGKHI